MKKKYLFTILIILVILVQIIPCFASTITKENFRSAVEEVVADTYTTSITDENIVINNKYYINYDLTDMPTFSIEINVTKNMTWNEWGEEFTKDTWLVIPFKAIAYIKGIDDEEISKATSYYNKNVILKKEYSDEITASNYTNYDIIQETKKMFKEDKIETELFTYRIEERNETDTTYSIKIIMEIKKDADFSKINENNDIIDDDVLNQMQQNAEIARNELEQTYENEEIAFNEMIGWIENKEAQNNITEIPQTGKTIEYIDVLWMLLVGSITVLAIYYIYNKRKDGKIKNG